MATLRESNPEAAAAPEPGSEHARPERTTQRLGSVEPTRPAATPSAPGPSGDEDPDPPFNPWRFGEIRMPPGLREALIKAELPEVPSERLWTTNEEAQAKGEGTTPPVVRSPESSAKDSGVPRTGRGPFWAIGVALAVLGVALLLLALRGSSRSADEPQPATPRPPPRAAAPSHREPPQEALGVATPAPAPSPPAKTLSQPPANTAPAPSAGLKPRVRPAQPPKPELARPHAPASKPSSAPAAAATPEPAFKSKFPD